MSNFELADGPARERLVEIDARALVKDSARRAPWSRAETLACVGGLTLFAVLYASVWKATGSVVPWDSKNQFYAVFRFLGDALAHGSVPLWNPYYFSGYPSVADPQSLVFTPTMLLLAWIDPYASMEVFDAAIFAHLILGGIGVLALFRRRGWSCLGALLASLIFVSGGPAASRLQHTGMIISYGFIPVAMWALEIALERASVRYGVLFAALFCCMAIGRDQVAFLACLMLVGCAAAHTAAAPSPLGYLRSRALVLTAIALVVMALLGPPCLLTLQFLASSNRPDFPFDTAAAGSLAPANFITLFAPNFFGSLNWTYDYWGPGYEALTAPDWTDRAINYLFIGTAPALLLFWHGVAAGRLLGREFRAFLIVAVVAILYALGRFTPVFAWLFEIVPGVALYRRPADATFILNIMFALGAGYLLHRYEADGAPRPFWRKLDALSLALVVGAGALVISMLVSAFSFSAFSQRVAESASQAALGLIGCLACGAMLAYASGVKARRLAAVILVVLTGGELWARDAASSLNAEPASRYPVYSGLSPDESAGLKALTDHIEARRRQGARPRVEILGMPGAWQNASLALKLENTLGYNPLRSADYQHAVGPGDNAQDATLRRYPASFQNYSCALASLLGIEYLVVNKPLESIPNIPKTNAVQIYASRDMNVYSLGPAAPRAYLAGSVALLSRTALQADFAGLQQPPRVALMDAAEITRLKGSYRDVQEGPVGEAKITSYEDDGVAIETNAQRSAILVLNDLYYPGWTASVDGAPAPIARVNMLFRGVETPAGRHKVIFSFHPLSAANLAAAALDQIRAHLP